MKQLQLELNKRLLIVELPDRFTYNTYADKMTICNEINKPIWQIEGKWEVICKGSELTEDIAKGFLHQSLHTGLFAHYVKDIPVNTYCYKKALEAFDAVIYAYGCHWGENPVKFNENEINWEKRHKNRIDWERVESRTFNPSKCIIFEYCKL